MSENQDGNNRAVDETTDQMRAAGRQAGQVGKQGAKAIKNAPKNIKRAKKVAKLGAKAAKIAVKAGARIVQLAISCWPFTLGILFLMVCFFIVNVVTVDYYNNKGVTQNLQTEDFTMDNELDSSIRLPNGLNPVKKLSTGNKAVKAYYSYFSDKSYYALVGSNDYLYNSDSDDFKNMNVKDKYGKEKDFYLSPDALFALDEFLNQQEFRTAEQFVRPVPYKRGKNSSFKSGYKYSLKSIYDGATEEVTVDSVKFDENGKITGKKEKGVWDYGFASVLHYEKFKEEYEQRGYKTKTQVWNKAKQKFENVDVPALKAEEVKNPLKDRTTYSHLIDQVVSPAGEISNKIKHEWADSGEKWTSYKEKSVKVDIKKKRLVQVKDMYGNRLYFEIDEDGVPMYHRRTTIKNNFPIMTEETYYVKESREMVEEFGGTVWEKIPEYDGEPNTKGLTGYQYYVDYITNYVNYVPADAMGAFDLKERLELSDKELKKLLEEADESKSEENATTDVSLSGLKLGSNASAQSYKNAIKYIAYFKKYGEMYGIDPYILVAMAAQESSGTLNSDNGAAFGIMQVELTSDAGGPNRQISAVNVKTGVKEKDTFSRANMRDNPDRQIKGGAMELQSAFRNPASKNNLLLALTGYNQGFGGLASILSRMPGQEITFPNIKKAATDYRAATGYGDPNYLQNVLQYYANPDKKTPWFQGADGKVYNFDGSSSGLNMGSVDSINGGTIVSAVGEGIRSLWTSFSNELNEGWSKLKGQVSTMFGIKGDYVNYTSTQQRQRFERSFDREYAVMVIKQIFALTEGKTLEDYKHFEEEDFKNKYMLLFSSPTGKTYKLTPEEFKKYAENFFPKGHQMPITGNIKIAKKFGENGDSVVGHNGIDIEITKNQNIYAVAEGKVIYASNSESGGVIIDHSQGIMSYYENISSIQVKEGDKIKKGQLIAKGSSNVESKNTLHFAVTRNGLFENMEWFVSGQSGDSDFIGGSGEYLVPMKEYVITSRFGGRILDGAFDYHNAIDLAHSNSTSPIYATKEGVVILAESAFSYGNYIIIKHANGLYSGYAHLSRFDVKAGDTVKSGQKIGNMGSTGNSSGPHLHFQIFKNGPWPTQKDFINPESVMKFK